MPGPYRAPGLLRGLADVRFRWMVTPRVISVLYVVVAGAMVAGSLVGLLLVWSMATWAGAGMWWFAPLVLGGGLAGVLGTRIACEWILMAFTRGRAIGPLPPSRPSPPAAPPAARPLGSGPGRWGGGGDA
ncbi:DUF4282 domain-containing protein [Actinomadura litoris]|uniref:DUF4282 domain-containing protein n=1 Tax=Actinomadura litoris TaxID=2678616 RepID=A0A7K1LEH3_9ACTN|nr:DUF4282 domain-containing protein [Actinomadura litoris]